MLRANDVVVTHVGRPCCIFSTTRAFSTLCDRSCYRPFNWIAACYWLDPLTPFRTLLNQVSAQEIPVLHSLFKRNWYKPLDDETVSMQLYRINGDFTLQGL